MRPDETYAVDEEFADFGSPVDHDREEARAIDEEPAGRGRWQRGSWDTPEDGEL